MELLRVISFWAGVLVLSALSAVLFHRFVETSILFRPRRLPQGHVFEFPGARPTEHWLEGEAGGRLHLLHFPADRAADHAADHAAAHAADSAPPPRGLVLYTHGNADNLQRWGHEARPFTALGYDVLMWDYRGFGKSRGRITEPLLLDDARRVYAFARQRVPPERLVLYGRSVGTGVSTYLAAHLPCRALALETPYTSLNAMTRLWLPRYPDAIQRFHLRQDRWLAQVAVPVLITHGTADAVVPYAMGAELARQAQARGQGVQFVTIPGGDHKHLPATAEWQAAVRAFLTDTATKKP